MNIVDQLRKATESDLRLIVYSVAGIISPGVLAIWVFAPSLVSSASTSKLVLLSLSFMLPIVTVNSAMIGVAIQAKHHYREAAHEFTLGSVFTMLLFSVSLATSLIFSLKFSTFAWTLFALEAVSWAGLQFYSYTGRGQTADE
jgi:hypothetical protein